MSWLRLLAFLAFSLNIVKSQDADRVITELETKTSTAHNAGMGGGGHIRVAVYTPEVHRMEAYRFPRYLVTNLVTNSSPNLVIHQIW